MPQTLLPIVWYHNSDGTVYSMTTNGTAVTGGAAIYKEPDTTWSIVGQGDFDGDGVRDLAWWNSRTGEVYLQFMENATTVRTGALVYREPNTAWRIVATGDLDGNGNTDLIWWNNQTGQVYGMLVNGSTISGGAQIWVEPDTNWRIVATGDTNGNGTADLIWWNSQTGQVYLLQMNSTSVAGGTLIYTESNTNWRIAGAGDLNGDGKADLVWHNRKTGHVYGMLLDGSSITNGVLIYVEPDVNWEIVSIGNYNSDNKADLLWWNQATGQVFLMPMNGLSMAGGMSMYQEPDTTWRIQGETEWKNNVYGVGVTTTSGSAPTPPGSVPTPPTDLTATAGDAEATVSWQPVQGATSYNVYVSTNPGVTKAGQKLANFTNGNKIINMINGTRYYLVVTAVNSAGESNVSNEVSVTPSAPNVGTSHISGKVAFGPAANSWAVQNQSKFRVVACKARYVAGRFDGCITQNVTALGPYYQSITFLEADWRIDGLNEGEAYEVHLFRDMNGDGLWDPSSFVEGPIMYPGPVSPQDFVFFAPHDNVFIRFDPVVPPPM